MDQRKLLTISLLLLAILYNVDGKEKDKSCMWCNKNNAEYFMNCMTRSILENDRFKSIPRGNVEDMRRSMLAASNAMTMTSPSSVMTMLNGALCGEMTGLMSQMSNKRQYSKRVLIEEIVKIITSCYSETSGQSGSEKFGRDLGRTVDFMMTENEVDNDFAGSDAVASSSAQSQSSSEPAQSGNSIGPAQGASSFASAQSGPNYGPNNQNFVPRSDNKPSPNNNNLPPMNNFPYPGNPMQSPGKNFQPNMQYPVNSSPRQVNNMKPSPNENNFASSEADSNSFSPSYKAAQTPGRSPSQPIMVNKQPQPPMGSNQQLPPRTETLPQYFPGNNQPQSRPVYNQPPFQGNNQYQPKPLNNNQAQPSQGNNLLSSSPSNSRPQASPGYNQQPPQSYSFASSAASSSTEQKPPYNNKYLPAQPSNQIQPSGNRQQYLPLNNNQQPPQKYIPPQPPSSSVASSAAASSSSSSTSYNTQQPQFNKEYPPHNRNNQFQRPGNSQQTLPLGNNQSPSPSSANNQPQFPQPQAKDLSPTFNNQAPKYTQPFFNKSPSSNDKEVPSNSQSTAFSRSMPRARNNRFPQGYNQPSSFSYASSSANTGPPKANNAPQPVENGFFPVNNKGIPENNFPNKRTNNSPLPNQATGNNYYPPSTGNSPIAQRNFVPQANPNQQPSGTSSQAFANTNQNNPQARPLYQPNSQENIPNQNRPSPKENFPNDNQNQGYSSSPKANSVSNANSNAAARTGSSPNSSSANSMADTNEGRVNNKPDGGDIKPSSSNYGNSGNSEACAMRFGEVLYVQLDKSPTFSKIFGKKTPKKISNVLLPEISKQSVEKSGYSKATEEVEALSANYTKELPEGSMSQMYAEKTSKAIMVAMYKFGYLKNNCEEKAKTIALNFFLILEIISPYFDSNTDDSTNQPPLKNKQSPSTQTTNSKSTQSDASASAVSNADDDYSPYDEDENNYDYSEKTLPSKAPAEENEYVDYTDSPGPSQSTYSGSSAVARSQSRPNKYFVPNKNNINDQSDSKDYYPNDYNSKPVFGQRHQRPNQIEPNKPSVTNKINANDQSNSSPEKKYYRDYSESSAEAESQSLSNDSPVHSKNNVNDQSDFPSSNYNEYYDVKPDTFGQRHPRRRKFNRPLVSNKNNVNDQVNSSPEKSYYRDDSNGPEPYSRSSAEASSQSNSPVPNYNNPDSVGPTYPQSLEATPSRGKFNKPSVPNKNNENDQSNSPSEKSYNRDYSNQPSYSESSASAASQSTSNQYPVSNQKSDSQPIQNSKNSQNMKPDKDQTSEMGPNPLLGKFGPNTKKNLDILMEACESSVSTNGYNYKRLSSAMVLVSKDIKIAHPDWSGDKILSRVFLETVVACTRVLQNLKAASSSKTPANKNSENAVANSFAASNGNSPPVVNNQMKTAPNTYPQNSGIPQNNYPVMSNFQNTKNVPFQQVNRNGGSSNAFSSASSTSTGANSNAVTYNDKAQTANNQRRPIENYQQTASSSAFSSVNNGPQRPFIQNKQFPIAPSAPNAGTMNKPIQFNNNNVMPANNQLQPAPKNQYPPPQPSPSLSSSSGGFPIKPYQQGTQNQVSMNPAKDSPDTRTLNNAAQFTNNNNVMPVSKYQINPAPNNQFPPPQAASPPISSASGGFPNKPYQPGAQKQVPIIAPYPPNTGPMNNAAQFNNNNNVMPVTNYQFNPAPNNQFPPPQAASSSVSSVSSGFPGALSPPNTGPMNNAAQFNNNNMMPASNKPVPINPGAIKNSDFNNFNNKAAPLNNNQAMQTAFIPANNLPKSNGFQPGNLQNMNYNGVTDMNNQGANNFINSNKVQQGNFENMNYNGVTKMNNQAANNLIKSNNVQQRNFQNLNPNGVNNVNNPAQNDLLNSNGVQKGISQNTNNMGFQQKTEQFDVPYKSGSQDSGFDVSQTKEFNQNLNGGFNQG